MNGAGRVADSPASRTSLTLKETPSKDQITVSGVRHTWRTNPSAGLTPERLAQIFLSADDGDTSQMMELYSEIEQKDPRIGGVLQTRRLSAAGRKWDIIPASDSDKDKQIADFIREMFLNIPDLDEDFAGILDSIGKGLSFTQMVWDVNESGQWIVRDLRWFPPWLFSFDWNDLTNVRVYTDQNPINGESLDLHPHKFLIHKDRTRPGLPARSGLLRPLAWYYLFKNYSTKDWVTYAEVYGMPLRVGKYDVGTSTDDKDALMNAVVNIGQDAAAIISKDTVIEFIEAAGRGEGPYKELINKLDTEVSILVLGHSGSVEGTPGRLGGEDNAENVRQDLLEADTTGLSSSLQQVIRPAVDVNFGTQPRYPEITFETEPKADLRLEAETDKILVVDMGLPASKEALYKKYNITPPTGSEDVLVVQKEEVLGGLPLKDLIVRSFKDPAEEGQEVQDDLYQKKKLIRRSVLFAMNSRNRSTNG